MLSNTYFEYFLAKVRFDTAENEPAKNLQYFALVSLLAGTFSRRYLKWENGENESSDARSGVVPDKGMQSIIAKPSSTQF